jgi:hypothetical protein
MFVGVGSDAVRGAWRARLLWRGASVVTLAALAFGGQARAAVTVDGGDKPVATATASSAGADDIAQTGTLNVPSGAAVTLNSSNDVTNSGTIQTQNASGLTGVLAQTADPGVTNQGSITNSGTISFDQSDTLTTTTSSGVTVGPFATTSNNFGIRVQGPGLFGGDIVSSGAITVQGQSSAGISVEGPMSGSILSSGSITVNGDDSYGVRTTAPVGGAVTITGGVAASGANAQAISLGGDVGGGLSISNAVVSTGYHLTTRSTNADVLADQNTKDAAQGGPAVAIGGSLGGGFLVAAPPATLSSTVSDLNGDGIDDAGEATGSVTSFGAAPAVAIGAVGRDISLGLVGTGDSAYGVVIAGSVTGSGLHDGVAANGLQIGVAGGGAVDVQGGVHVTGSVTATAFGADATAVHLLAGASVPVLDVTNKVVAEVTGASPNAAQAIVVEPGASLQTLKNGGIVQAVVSGASGSAAAIVDRSGALTRVENTGTILGGLVLPSASQVTVDPSAVAIDASANTTGFSLLSYQSAGDAAPAITGAVRMGSGGDSVDIEAGTLAGDLSFGAGANALTVNGGASVAGALSADGGTLALTVGSGSLQINSANRLNLTSLNLGAGSTVIVTADPAAGLATQFDVDGPAQIAQGAKLGLRVISLADGAQAYTLVRANQLSGGFDTSLLASTPYIYDASLSTDAAAGTVTLNLGRKTAAELDLPSSVAGAYEPLVGVVGANAALSQTLLTPTDRAGFMSAYDQLLPEHSGGVFQLVRAGVEGFGRPLDDRQSTEGGGGAWMEEVNVGLSAGDRDGLPGYRGWGVGLIAGLELPPTPVGIFGATLGGFSGELRPHDADPNAETIANVIEAGGYWRAAFGPFAVNARAAVDHLSATGHRVVTVSSDGESLFSGTADGHWSGWAVAGRVRVSYEARWNTLYLRPQFGLDYLRLSEGAYDESGGGAIDLAVGERKTSELAGFAGAAVGAVFGQDGAFWGPELLLGYRDVFSGDDGATTARFLSGGDSFTVGPNPVADGGAVARVALKSENGWGAFAIEGGTELRSGLDTYDVKLAAHIRF